MARTVHIQVRLGEMEFHYACPAQSLYPRLPLLPPKAHARLVDKLANMLGRGVIEGAARLAFIVAMCHPVYGTSAQKAFNEAADAFERVVLSVALTADGIGFGVGNEPVADRLHETLKDGERGEGMIGVWPVFH